MKLLLAMLLGVLVFGAILFGIVRITTESATGSNSPNGVTGGIPLPASVVVPLLHS